MEIGKDNLGNYLFMGYKRIKNGTSYLLKIIATCSEGLLSIDGSDQSFEIKNTVCTTTHTTTTTTSKSETTQTDLTTTETESIPPTSEVTFWPSIFIMLISFSMLNSKRKRTS